MAWRTPVCGRLGIDHPIVQAPMASVATPELAAAVSNAGGLGSLGCATLDPEAFRARVAEVRARTNRPFNVNFFVHAPPRDDPARALALRRRLAPYYAEFGLGEVPPLVPGPPPFNAEMCEAVVAARPAVVSFHFGLPEPALVEAVKAAGAVVMATATAVAEARHLAERGVDVIIAQGYEAGGHRGTFAVPYAAGEVGTMALVPQVVDAVAPVPVIAAGGIADGRGVAAALALGAQAAQLGTAFLTCPECGTSEPHRRLLLAGAVAGTRITAALTGRPARCLDNRYVREMAGYEGDLPDFPSLRAVTTPLARAAEAAGSTEFSPHWAGQAAPLARNLLAAELVAALAREAEAALAGPGAGRA